MKWVKIAFLWVVKFVSTKAKEELKRAIKDKLIDKISNAEGKLTRLTIRLNEEFDKKQEKFVKKFNKVKDKKLDKIAKGIRRYQDKLTNLF